jgi:hypothetical protein
MHQRVVKTLRKVHKKPIDGSCQACGDKPSATLQCDHDHTTLMFRGYVCGPCNKILGLARDHMTKLGLIASYYWQTVWRSKQAHLQTTATEEGGQFEYTDEEMEAALTLLML